MIGVERGSNRVNMVIKQLPFRESEGGAGGIPLEGSECDDVCVPHMGRGVINLTDGASAYEAFAGGELRCSVDCQRKDCLRRAQQKGKDKCLGKRPRAGRDRFAAHYKHLRLSVCVEA